LGGALIVKGNMKLKRRAIIVVGVVTAILVICSVTASVAALIALNSPTVSSMLEELVAIVTTFDDMGDLKRELQSQYQAEAVSVTIDHLPIENGKSLEVALFNSPLRGSTESAVSQRQLRQSICAD
jgi:hypothetical protein